MNACHDESFWLATYGALHRESGWLGAKATTYVLL